MVGRNFFEQCRQKRNLSQLNFAVLVLRQGAWRNAEIAGDLFIGDLPAVEGAVQINRRIDNEIAFFDGLPAISGKLGQVKLLFLKPLSVT